MPRESDKMSVTQLGNERADARRGLRKSSRRERTPEAQETEEPLGAAVGDQQRGHVWSTARSRLAQGQGRQSQVKTSQV